VKTEQDSRGRENPTRQKYRVALEEEADESTFQIQEAELDDSLPALLEARSDLQELRLRLCALEQRILDLRAEEFSEAEMAVELGKSQQTVSWHWRAIIRAARELGLARLI